MPGLLRLADSCAGSDAALSPPRAPVSTRKQETDLGEDDLGEDGQRLGGRVGAQGPGSNPARCVPRSLPARDGKFGPRDTVTL